MGNVTTASQTTAPSNPDVNPTVSKLLKGVQTEFGKTPQVFGQSLYPGVGGTTQQAWQGALGAANNPTYSSAVNNTIGDFGAIASGQRFGMDDPGYAKLRQGVIDDTQANINSQFTNSGRFGGGSHVQALGEGIGNAVAGLDYANYQNDQQRQLAAAGMLPGLFSASMAPSSAIGAVGAAQDADALAQRQGAFDLFTRQNDAGWGNLAKASSVLGGTAPFGGQTSEKQVPWWAAGLGAGATLAGMF